MSAATYRSVLLGLHSLFFAGWMVAAPFAPFCVVAVVGAAWSAFWIGRLL